MRDQRPRFFLAALFLGFCIPLSAATITVTGSGSVYDLAQGCAGATMASLPGTDGQVSLPEAICAANGSGGATISLGVDVSLTGAFPTSPIIGFAAAGTPDISTKIVIVPAGGSTIARSSASGTPDFRIFRVVSGGDLTLQGVTVSNGRIAPQALPGFGNVLQAAGIRVEPGGTLRVLAGAMVRDNYLEAPNTIQTTSNVGEGAGIWSAGTLIIDSSTISGNTAIGGKNLIFFTGGEGRGGGVYNSGTATVTNATFSNNKAKGGGGFVFEGNFSSRGGYGKGGGIFSDVGATLTVTGGTFDSDRADAAVTQSGVAGNGGGGAIYNAGTIPSISGTLFQNCIVQGAEAAIGGNTYGAAIFNAKDATIALIHGATFHDNHAYGPVTVNLVCGDIFEAQIQINNTDCPPETTAAGVPCEGVKLITETTIPALFSNAGGNNRGGAIYTEGKIALIDGSTLFDHNEALGAGAIFHSGGAGYGGAIAVGPAGRIDDIHQATFDTNKANGGNAGDSGGDGRGGAIWVRAGGSIGTIRDSKFTGNVADGANGYPNPTKTKITKIKDVKKLLSDGGSGKGGAIYVDKPIQLFEGGPIEINPGPAGKVESIANCTFDGNTGYGGGGVNGADGDGGAIFANGDLPSITGSTFTKNATYGEFGLQTSGAFGGAIYFHDGTATMADTTLDSNRVEGGDGVAGLAKAQGGGIYVDSTAVTLNRVTVTSNVVQGGNSGAGDGAADGAGIYSEKGNLTISDSVVAGNSAYGGGSSGGGNATGGGIATLGDQLSITRTRISGNYLKAGTGIAGGQSYGAGVSIRTRLLLPNPQTATITDSVFRDNTASGGNGVGHCSAYGGGLQLSPGITTTVQGTTFSNNVVTGGSGEGCDAEGGGIVTDSANLTLINCTLVGNRCKGSDGVFDGGDGRGGAIRSNGGTKIYNSTIASNHVQKGNGIGGYEDGGGIFIGTGTTALFSTILYGNTRGANNDTHNCYGTFVSLGYNLLGELEQGYCTAQGTLSNNRSGDPLLQSLANNGGPDAPDVAPFTAALGTGSDAIDHGNCALSTTFNGTAFSNTITTDQRGGTRGSLCDVGAFEAGAPIVAPTLPILSASPAPGAFPVTGSGATATGTISMTNVGGSTLSVTLTSLSAGYTITTGLPISGLASGNSAPVAVQCTPGTTAAGTLTVATNESGAPTHTWNLSCANPAMTSPVFASTPDPGLTIPFDASPNDATLTITNRGAAGTLLDVSQISFNPSYAVSGLPITGLASGASIQVHIHYNGLAGRSDDLVVKTNEPGNPTYSFALAAAAVVGAPTLDPAMLLLLAFLLGLTGWWIARR